MADSHNHGYLGETAIPGGTMGQYGLDATLGNIHPEMKRRLEAAIREARAEGINAGVGSGYRAPGWGVGGFSDKYNSMHAYGAGVDMSGIGRPGSREATRWYEIATKHGLVNPYGPSHQAEWNHYQLIPDKVAPQEWRSFVSDQGPKDQQAMWNAVMPVDPFAPPVSGAEAPHSVNQLGMPTGGPPPSAPRNQMGLFSGELPAAAPRNQLGMPTGTMPPSVAPNFGGPQQPADDDERRRRLAMALTPEYVRQGGNDDFSSVSYGYAPRYR